MKFNAKVKEINGKRIIQDTENKYFSSLLEKIANEEGFELDYISCMEDDSTFTIDCYITKDGRKICKMPERFKSYCSTPGKDNLIGRDYDEVVKELKDARNFFKALNGDIKEVEEEI